MEGVRYRASSSPSPDAKAPDAAAKIAIDYQTHVHFSDNFLRRNYQGDEIDVRTVVTLVSGLASD